MKKFIAICSKCGLHSFIPEEEGFWMNLNELPVCYTCQRYIRHMRIFNNNSKNAEKKYETKLDKNINMNVY